MIRVINFCCFAVTALVCLALYDVSDETRVTHNRALAIRQQIGDEQRQIKALEIRWQELALPGRIQQLAASESGSDDAPAVVLSSLTMLPRKGESSPIDDAQVRSANAIVPSGD
ncbi:MAG TPA: hypothetical protein VGM17_10315 [Rhizomicrobium sp.]|jgi:hypothetical protein